MKIVNVAEVEDGEYDWIEENQRYLWSSRFQWIVFFWWWILYKKKDIRRMDMFRVCKDADFVNECIVELVEDLLIVYYK